METITHPTVLFIDDDNLIRKLFNFVILDVLFIDDDNLIRKLFNFVILDMMMSEMTLNKKLWIML